MSFRALPLSSVSSFPSTCLTSLHGRCLCCSGQSCLPCALRYLLCYGLWPHCSLWEQCPSPLCPARNFQDIPEGPAHRPLLQESLFYPLPHGIEVTSYPTLTWKGAAPPQLGLVVYGPDLSLCLPTCTQDYVTLRKGNTLIFLFPSAYYCVWQRVYSS